MSAGVVRPTGSKPPRPPLFADTYRPVTLPWLYRPAAAMMVVLALLQPLIYFAAIAAMSWATAAWAILGVRLLESAGSVPSTGMGYGSRRATVGLMLLKLFVYLTPLACGVMVVLLLLGALIPSRRDPGPGGYPLARVEHPLIYAYVDRLCDIMRAPRPVRIDLAPDANASASFDGRWSWLVRRRLVLTVGATLVAGMTRRELTGVIAHELGHFTQGLGMRSTRVVGAINTWFERVVHHRGMIDDMLEDAGDSEWALLALGAALVKLALTLVRGLLWMIASGSRLATLGMVRRMEMAADRCQTRVAGSAATVSSLARLVELSDGFDKAYQVARHESAQRRLPENLSDLAMNILPRRPRDPRGFIAGWVDKPSLWSSHPPLGHRAAAAIAMNEPGIVLTDGPAVKLLPGFQAVSRAVTIHAFNQVLSDTKGVRFLSTDALLQRGTHDPARAIPPTAPVYRKKGEINRPAAAVDDDVIPFAD